MTNLQRHTIRASEIRTRLNEIGGLDGDAVTEEVRAEETALQGEYRTVESQLRAAVAAEETETRESRPAEVDAEERERRELASRVGTAPFIAAAAQGLAVSGEARELSDAYGAGGFMPLSLLGNVDRAAGVEARAVTPGVNEDGTDMTAPYIFERTVCERLVPGCIRMVPTGAYHSVTLSTAPTAGLLDKSADALNTAGVLALQTRRAVRVSGQAEFQIEDAAILGDIESTLNGALTMLIASQVDEAIITGQAASPDFNGLFDIATAVARPAAERGALEWPADGVVLKRAHNDGTPIMRVIPEVRGDSVIIDAPLPETTAGRDAARELRDGLFTGLSVEFRAAVSRYAGGLRNIRRAMLTGAGLVHNPSYPGSAVEVRAQRRRFVL